MVQKEGTGIGLCSRNLRSFLIIKVSGSVHSTWTLLALESFAQMKFYRKSQSVKVNKSRISLLKMSGRSRVSASPRSPHVFTSSFKMVAIQLAAKELRHQHMHTDSVGSGKCLGFEVPRSYLSSYISDVHGMGKENNLSEHISFHVKWHSSPNPRKLRGKKRGSNR